MQLSKNSWHYRNFEMWQKHTNSRRHLDLLPRSSWYFDEEHRELMEELAPRRRPDLCTYTRIAILYGPGRRVQHWFRRHQNIADLFMVSFFILLLSAGLLMVSFGILGEGRSWWAYVLGALSIAGVIVAGFSIPAAIQTVKNRRYDKIANGEAQPSIITERIKAHKSKVCPMIEFKETV